MPASKAHQIRMKKGQKDAIKAHADGQGESINGFIIRAIREAIERDTEAAGGRGGSAP